MLTPCVARSNDQDATMLNTTTSSAAGNRGRKTRCAPTFRSSAGRAHCGRHRGIALAIAVGTFGDPTHLNPASPRGQVRLAASVVTTANTLIVSNRCVITFRRRLRAGRLPTVAAAGR